MHGAMGRVLAAALAAASLPISRSVREVRATGMDFVAASRRGLHSTRLGPEQDCVRMRMPAESTPGLAFVAHPWILSGGFGQLPLRRKGFPNIFARARHRTAFAAEKHLSMSTQSRKFSPPPAPESSSESEEERISLVNKAVYQDTMQCPKLGWHRRRSLVQVQPSEAEMLLAEQGEEIEAAFFQHRYRGSELENGPSNLRQQATDTQVAMREIAERFGKEVPNVTKGCAVTQATFIAGECVARADVVEYVGDDQWDIMEVKSCTDKNYLKHLTDLAFTVHTAMESGVKVRCALLVVINSSFRMGMDSGDIFKILNCTEELFSPFGPIATLQGPASDGVSLEHVTKVTSLPAAPKGVLASTCKQCPLFGDCVPKTIEHPIWHLPRLHGKRFQQVSSVALDIKLVEDEMLTEAQRKHRACVLKNAPVIARKALRKGLASLQAPLFFLDFESFSTWTPTLPGQSPLEQVVSQYSLHVSDTLEVKAPEQLTHREFLGASVGDFREELLESLLDDLGPSGSIIVYSPYEKTQLTKMAALFPDRGNQINGVISRLVDLEPLIRANVQHPDFNGRTSLKVTLPVLVPAYSGRYKALNINDGAHAAAAFQRIRSAAELSAEEEAALRSELLAYCKLDTLAMVELLQAVQRLAEQP